MSADDSPAAKLRGVCRWRRLLCVASFLAMSWGTPSAFASEEAETEESARVTMDLRDGLVFATPGNRAALHGYGWLRAASETRVSEETDVAASIPVARLFTVAHLLDARLGIFVQVEFAKDAADLLDLFAEWRFSEALRLRAGQFRTPYARAYITPLTNLSLVSRGAVVDRFNLGRDTGVMLNGTLGSGRFHYDLGVVNGATIIARADDRDAPSGIARLELRLGDPVPYDQSPSLARRSGLRGVTLGVGGAYAQRALRDAGGTSTEQQGHATADIAAALGPIALHVEGFWRHAHGTPRVADAFGAYSQLGVFVVPGRLEIGSRAGWISDGPDVESFEAYVAGYASHRGESLAHHLKLVLVCRYDTGDVRTGSGEDRVAETVQAQFFF